MSQSSLYRIAALGLMAGAILVAVCGLLSPQGSNLKAVVESALYYPTAVGVLVGGVLIIAGWPAVYIRQRAETGVLGLVAMLMVLVAGMLLTVAAQFSQTLFFPWLTTLPVSNSQLNNGPAAFGVFFPVASAVVGLGGILFGVATIRARVYSRQLGIGFIVLALASFVLGFLNLPGALSSLGGAVYMVALAWAGFELWMGTAASPAVSASQSGAIRTPSAS